MTTATRVNNIFNQIKRDNLKLYDYGNGGIQIFGCYTINSKRVEATKVSNKPGWEITVFYRKKIMAYMTFDLDFKNYGFDYLYPFPNLRGNGKEAIHENQKQTYFWK